MKKLSLVLALVLFGIGSMLAQRTVSGTVTDNSGEALIGASVLVKGTTTGTVTDIDGAYRVTVPDGSNTLVISYTGFTTQEVELGASNVVDIVMEEGVTLETAVVTALGIERDEKSVGYAVESVSNDEILKANEANLVSALSGKVAGLNVTASTGTAGASAFFLIRGANTINGDNQPLIVIDGVPVDNQQLSSGATPVASVAYSNRAIDINQNEIESVTVLKGAAATALYGSLAGNGAIIITTKRAARGQNISVDFSTQFTISEFNKVPELQNEFAQGLFGQYSGPETGSGYSYGPRVDTLSYANDAGDYPFDPNGSIVSQNDPNATGTPINVYDQYDFFRRGFSQSYNFGISASNATSSIRFSGGFLNDDGIIPNNSWGRLNLGLNADTKLGDNINIGFGVQYINSGGTRIEQGSNTSGVMLGLTRTAPTFDNAGGVDDPVNDSRSYQFEDGTQRNYRGGGGYDNPYWTVNQNPLTDEVNRFITNLNFSWDIAPWVNLSWRPGLDYYVDFRKQFFAIGSRTYPAGQVFEDQFEYGRVNSDLLLTFNRDINEWMDATLTIGHNIRQTQLDRLYTQGDGLVIPNFYDISNVAAISTVFADNTLQRNQGVFGMLELGLWDNVYLTGTYRVESDLSLPEDNNTYSYYSVSGSWVWSELLDANDVLSFGKLRASFGRVGLGTFAYSTDTYFINPNLADGWTNGLLFPNGSLGTAFSLSNQRGAPGLRPEVQTSWEVGLDLRFFQNRVGLDLTYYSGLSEDVILGVPVAGSSGYTSIVANSASLSNTGFEILLDVTPVSTPSFEWNLGVNFARNVNEVVELADGVDNVSLGGFVGSSTRAVVGVPYGSIFGFGFYEDANGETVIGADGFPILDPNEKAFGSALPDWTMGIRNTFSFKGISLSALLDIKQGGVVWNGTKSALYFWGTHQETAELRNTMDVFDGNLATYDSEGRLVLEDHDNDPDTPEIPVTAGANTQEVLIDENWLAFGNANGFFGNNTADFIEDASWVRLRDVSLSYALPASVLDGTPLSALSLTVSGRNLWLDTPYTGVDPETNLYGASNAQGLDYFNMPNTKSYSIGLNVRF